MVIVLYPDDLVYNFEGNKKRPTLNDFPAIENIDFGPFDVILYKNGKDELTLKSPLPPETGDFDKEILDKIGSKGLRNILIMLSPNSSEVRSALNNVVDDIVQKLETEEKWEEAKMGLLVSDDIKDEEEAFDAFTNGNFQAAWLLFKS